MSSLLRVLGLAGDLFHRGIDDALRLVREIGEHAYRPGNVSLSLMDAYSKLVRRQG